jgi:hypothetical protein
VIASSKGSKKQEAGVRQLAAGVGATAAASYCTAAAVVAGGSGSSSCLTGRSADKAVTWQRSRLWSMAVCEHSGEGV